MTKLAKTLEAYQRCEGVEGKALAAEIGIAESTLTRIKQGKLTDAVGFARIVMWLVSK